MAKADGIEDSLGVPLLPGTTRSSSRSALSFTNVDSPCLCPTFPPPQKIFLPIITNCASSKSNQGTSAALDWGGKMAHRFLAHPAAPQSHTVPRWQQPLSVHLPWEGKAHTSGSFGQHNSWKTLRGADSDSWAVLAIARPQSPLAGGNGAALQHERRGPSGDCRLQGPQGARRAAAARPQGPWVATRREQRPARSSRRSAGQSASPLLCTPGGPQAPCTG